MSKPIELTPRERDIFELRTRKMPLKQIALRFGISVKTVDCHLYNIRRKLKIIDAAEIVRQRAAAHQSQNAPASEMGASAG